MPTKKKPGRPERRLTGKFWLADPHSLEPDREIKLPAGFDLLAARRVATLAAFADGAGAEPAGAADLSFKEWDSLEILRGRQEPGGRVVRVMAIRSVWERCSGITDAKASSA